MIRPNLTCVFLAAVSTILIVWGSAGVAEATDRLSGDSLAAVEMMPSDEVLYYLQRQTDGNALGLVMTNYGFFGNNLVTRAPSMEYPLGSEIEHLVRAGLWVGAFNADGDRVVSTGCISGTWGGGSANATEYYPVGKIKARSTLISSRDFSKKAISEQDFVMRYTDNDPTQRPKQKKVLTIGVTQRSYLWSYDFAEAFVIVSLTIKNEGPGILSSLHLGMYGELCSGWKGAYDVWRSSSHSASWFDRKAIEYFPEQRMIGEHHYTYQDGTAPSWGAFALLGTRGNGIPPLGTVPVAFNWWDWTNEGSNPQVYTDSSRFELMANREIDDWREAVPLQYDPVEMLSAGPFPEMALGDSIVLVCAFLGGMDRASLIENAQWAQRAFDNNYILPSPPQPARFKITPASGAVDLYWDSSPENTLDPFYNIPDFEGYRIFITRKDGATSDDFELVRDVDIIDGTGYDTGFDSIRETNQIDTTVYDYHYRISNLKDGFKYWVSLASYDKGMPEQGVESMQSGVLATKVLAIPGPSDQANATVHVFPNPYKGEAVWDGARDREKYVWFINLPRRATIRIFTLAGDLVKSIEFDAATYTGADVQGLKTGSERNLAMPGGMCAWDLISQRDQAVATGLYLFSVEDKVSGKNQVGKFMVIR